MAFPVLAATNSSSPAPSEHPETASPGAINYVEGRASIGNEALSSTSVGKIALQAGQTVNTENGRVEVLLTPGVFLRLGNDTSVTMMSPSLTNTRVKVNSGEASVEVDQYYSQQNLMIAEGDSTSYLVHTGLYDFVSQQGVVRVIKGQAVVVRNDHHVRVNSGQEVNLYPETVRLKAKKFDVDQYKKEDPLYSWTKLRSQYLAEANVKVASYLYGWNRSGLGWGPGWWGWYGPGWYWNPWFMSYTFAPGAGVIDSPFGWGFYSPWTFGLAPYSVYGGRIRRFRGGFDSWAMRPLRRPNVRGHGHGFVHNGAGFPNRSFRGGFRSSGVQGAHRGRH